MISFVHSDLHAFKRKANTIFLAFSFFIAFLFGIFTFSQSEDSIIPLMRGSTLSSVSIFDFVTCALLPFLLSAIVVYLNQLRFLYLICSMEAFLYSFVSMVFIYAYPAPGSFIRLIFLFGDFILLPLLFLYWIRIHSNGRSHINTWTLLFLAAASLLRAVEYRFIVSLCLI